MVSAEEPNEWYLVVSVEEPNEWYLVVEEGL